ncbi:MAG: hypothetical protein HC913_19565 [Microscillaceae bacterium]|nr:hypothetical protein [Microscillaceae bacterium]
MPDKTPIDHLFRKIAQNHEEPFCPDDWQDLQKKLKACGLQKNLPDARSLGLQGTALDGGAGLGAEPFPDQVSPKKPVFS